MSTMSPGSTKACTTILLVVLVPLVAKKVCLLPNAREASCCAVFSGPVGCSNESRPPVVALVSARKRLRP